MKSIFLSFVRISPRVYELGSVLLTAGGINILTGTIGKAGFTMMPEGLLMILSGVLFWLSAWLVAKYRDRAFLQRRILQQQAMNDTAEGRQPILVSSITELALAEAKTQKPGRIIAESITSIGALLLATLAFVSLFVAQKAEKIYKMEMNPPVSE